MKFITTIFSGAASCVPDGRGQGVFWREPAVGHRGSPGARSFFDEDGNSLPVLNVFDKYTRPVPNKSGE